MATRIVEFQPGKDDEEVLALRSEVWGSDHAHTSSAFYAWLFGDSGIGEKASGILVRRDDKLVCFAGLVPRTARRNGDIVRIAHGLDFMASPGLQGLSGLYAYKLVKSWIEHAKGLGYDYAACFPNDQSIRLLTSDKLNWKIVASPRLFVLPTTTVRFEDKIAGLPKSLATLGGRVLAAGLSVVRSKARIDASVGILDPVRDAGELDALWQRVSGGKWQFTRQSAVLRWRYGGNPVYSYRILVRRSQSGISGFIVTTRRKVMGLESDLVVDGLWDTGDAETARLLLSAVEARAKEEGTGILAGLALPATPFHAALRGAGFLPVPVKFDPKPFHLVSHPLTDAGAKCMDQVDWDLTWGDMDVV